MIHHGLDIDAYAEAMAALAHWPNDRGAVFRRLAISEERLELAAAAFRLELVAESNRGGDALAERFRVSFEAARQRLAQTKANVAELSPLRVLLNAAKAETKGASPAATAMIDPAEAAKARASLPARKKDALNLGGTLEIKAPAPFVPKALPFAPVPDEEVERYAELTADLELFPKSKPEVLGKHRVADDDALARERSVWAERFDKDVRLKMQWEGLHRSFVGFVQRQRARGKEPKL